MHMVPAPFDQPLPADGFQIPVGRAVEKDRGRIGGFVARLHFNRVSLAGADAHAVGTESETLLVVAVNHLVQFGPGQGVPGPEKTRPPDPGDSPRMIRERS